MMNLRLLSPRHPETTLKRCAYLLLGISFLGFLDASYLTIEHYQGVIPPCSIVNGCEKVLTSRYAVVLGIPVALFGALYYLSVFLLSIAYIDHRPWALALAARLTPVGFLASLGFVYIQFFVLHALCLYCLFSALTSTLLFGIGIWIMVLRKCFPVFEPRA